MEGWESYGCQDCRAPTLLDEGDRSGDRGPLAVPSRDKTTGDNAVVC